MIRGRQLIVGKLQRMIGEPSPMGHERWPVVRRLLRITGKAWPEIG